MGVPDQPVGDSKAVDEDIVSSTIDDGVAAEDSQSQVAASAVSAASVPQGSNASETLRPPTS